MKVSLSKINDVKKFVEVMNDCPIEADLISGHYVIDAKSLMGIFSLDLSNPIEIVFHDRLSDSEYEKIKEFVVE